MEKLLQNERKIESAFKDMVRHPRSCKKLRRFIPSNVFQDFVPESPTVETEKQSKKNEKSPYEGYKKYAPANPKQIVESISGLDYMNVILSKGRSAIDEPKQPANGYSLNFDEERAPDVVDSRIEKEDSTMEELFPNEGMIESPFKNVVRRPRSCRKRREFTPSNVFQDSVLKSPMAETEKQNKKNEKSPHPKYKGGSATNEPKQPANGSSSNLDVERVLGVESHDYDLRIEGEGVALKMCEQEEQSDVLNIEARVTSLEIRFSKIEEILAELRN